MNMKNQIIYMEKRTVKKRQRRQIFKIDITYINIFHFL